MMGSLFTAAAGIRSFQARMNVLGDNIANVDTPGFKASRVNFQEMLAQTLRPATAPSAGRAGGTNPVQIGLGVGIGSTTTMQSQGRLQLTGQPTDFAVEGNGLFIVNDGTRNYYTRDGAFALDQEGNLVMASNGFRVQGYPASTSGGVTSTGALSSITIPLGQQIEGVATTNAVFQGNLDSSGATYSAGPPPTGASTTVTGRFYDSLGQAQDVVITYMKSATTGVWNWSASYEGAAIPSANGTLTFDATGTLVSSTPASPSLTITAATLGNGAADLTVSLDFTSLAQRAGSSSVTMTTQDGAPPGALQSFSVGQDGMMTGIYSNGLSKSLGQIAVATFSNPGGLSRLGGNLYSETANSGVAQTGAPMTADRGSMVQGALEQSNVDLTQEFIDLIVTQRGFQANSRVITASDQLLQELLTVSTR